MCLHSFRECSTPGASAATFYPLLAGDQVADASFLTAISLLQLFALSTSAHFDPGSNSVVSSIKGLDFLPTFRIERGTWRVEAWAGSSGLDWAGGCGLTCAVATGVSGLMAGGVAGGICTFTVGIGCGIAITAAVGTTSLVFESTSNPGADGGDLACSFFFGPSNGVANVVSTAASGGLTAATQGGKAAIKSVVQNVAFGEVGGALCD